MSSDGVLKRARVEAERVAVEVVPTDVEMVAEEAPVRAPPAFGELHIPVSPCVRLVKRVLPQARVNRETVRQLTRSCLSLVREVVGCYVQQELIAQFGQQMVPIKGTLTLTLKGLLECMEAHRDGELLMHVLLLGLPLTKALTGADPDLADSSASSASDHEDQNQPTLEAFFLK